MNNEIRKAVDVIFAAIDLPTDRLRARTCANYLNTILLTCQKGYSIAYEDLENVRDQEHELTNKMYPMRGGDMSTPAMKEEMRKLLEERDCLEQLCIFLQSMITSTEKKLGTAKRLELSSLRGEMLTRSGCDL